MKDKEYIIFCDESLKKGKYYSNFYGGIIVGSSNYAKINEQLNNKKTELNLFKEVKWNKVTPEYLGKYKELISFFFAYVKAKQVKIRIMFSQNRYTARSLTNQHIENEYFLLYYQFIKHAFGLKYIPEDEYNFNLRLLFDEFPETKEKIRDFKSYLLRLNNQDEFQYIDYEQKSIHKYHLYQPKFRLLEENIGEVSSHNHVLIQCLDIILGSMAFKLNKMNKIIPIGQKIRGKTTRAKDDLYNYIYQEICSIRKGFNTGISTSTDGDNFNNWDSSYRHWCFKPKNHDIDFSQME